MAVKKSALKQHLKFILQKTLLPLCYHLGLCRARQRGLIILADSNIDSLPEAMTLIAAELKKRGFTLELHCRDISRCGLVGTLSFMCRFMLRYAAAQGVVVCNYFVPLHACKKRPDTFVTQLWHSCGALKKFGYSTPSDISPHFKGSVSKNIDLVTVSAPLCEAVFEEALALPEGVARAVGVSRTDVFFDDDYKSACVKKLHRLYPRSAGKRLIVYMPTFRGDASHAYSVGHEEVAALGESLGEDFYIVVRMHPRVRDGVFDMPKLSANELLICADMLITDYSSAIFEYSLLDKPMLLWCPDLREYLSERDLYLDIRRDIPCPLVSDKADLAAAVKRELSDFKKGSYAEFTKKYMSACDGSSTRRIADIISENIK